MFNAKQGERRVAPSPGDLQPTASRRALMAIRALPDELGGACTGRSDVLPRFANLLVTAAVLRAALSAWC